MKPKFKVGDIIYQKGKIGRYKVILVLNNYCLETVVEDLTLWGFPNGSSFLANIGCIDRDFEHWQGEGYQDTSETYYCENPTPELLKLAEVFGDKVLTIPESLRNKSVDGWLRINNALEINLETYLKSGYKLDTDKDGNLLINCPISRKDIIRYSKEKKDKYKYIISSKVSNETD